MPQIFRPSSNKFAHFSLIASVVFLLILAVSAYGYFQSSYYNDVGVFHEQPLPFSHKHHVQGLGMDCRFCHFSVEKSSSAGMPSTEVCMSCHSQIFKESEDLRPLHKSFEENRPLQWNRVHNLPDYVFFNHSIHVNKGVTCVSCHGDIKDMPLTAKEKPMTMKWCLECHTHPEAQIKNAQNYQIDRPRLNNCYECHR